LDVSGIQTNRDLYLAIADLTEGQRSGTRDLEEYLRALWGEARRFRERTFLSADVFFRLLSAAFTLPAPAFQEAWRPRCPGNDTNPLAACVAAKIWGVVRRVRFLFAAERSGSAALS